MSESMPRYPIYIPSKGRAKTCLTARFMQADGCPFTLVVEPSEAKEYAERFGSEHLLILPWNGDDKRRRAYCAKLGIENGGLIAVRNWIKDHAIAAGYERHWQFDDNIRAIYRRYSGERFYCEAGVALRACEDFVDRYENIAIAGLQYVMFARKGLAFPPFFLNHHVYSGTLVLNSLPNRWRIRYNDDTDMCLQVLAAGWCTVLFNAFLIQKVATMKIKGGNTAELYQGDGRLKMARSLERLWPGVVTVGKRFQRPQHFVKDEWRDFDTPLRLKPGLDLSALPTNEYGMELAQVRPEIKSPGLQQIVNDFHASHQEGKHGKG